MAPWFRPKNCCLRSSASFSTSFLCASSVSTLALTSDFQRKGRLHMSWIGYLVTPWPQCVSSAQFFRDRFWWINTMSSQMDQPPSKGTAPWLLLPAPVDKTQCPQGETRTEHDLQMVDVPDLCNVYLRGYVSGKWWDDHNPSFPDRGSIGALVVGWCNTRGGSVGWVNIIPTRAWSGTLDFGVQLSWLI